MHQKSNLHIIGSSILSDFSTDSNTKGSEHASNGSNHESCIEVSGTIPKVYFPFTSQGKINYDRAIHEINIGHNSRVQDYVIADDASDDKSLPPINRRKILLIARNS